MRPGRATMGLAAALLLPMGAAFGDDGSEGAAGSLEQSYQKQWQERAHVGITRALSDAQLRQCVRYKYKRNNAKQARFLVRCTADGRTWKTFLVDADRGYALGPYQPTAAYD